MCEVTSVEDQCYTLMEAVTTSEDRKEVGLPWWGLFIGSTESGWVCHHLSAAPSSDLTREVWMHWKNPSDWFPTAFNTMLGTMLAPFLFTLQAADFFCNSSDYHLQKFPDDSAWLPFLNLAAPKRPDKCCNIFHRFLVWLATFSLFLIPYICGKQMFKMTDINYSR